MRLDLAPLIAMLRSGAPLGRSVRRELVHAMEKSADALFHLELRKTKPGPGNPASQHRTFLKRAEIAGFVAEHFEAQPLPRKKEAAVQAAMSHFSVSRSLVMDICKDERAGPRTC
jgi:ferredoxin-NADP reductase